MPEQSEEEYAKELSRENGGVKWKNQTHRQKKVRNTRLNGATCENDRNRMGCLQANVRSQ